MITKFTSLALLIAIFLTQVPTALAQGSTSQGQGWATLQAIPADERLIVKQKDGQTVEGKMIEASDTNLTISRNNKVVNISRNNIQQVHHSKGKAAKGKWAGIGAGLGAGTGAGIGAYHYSRCSSDCGIFIIGGLALGAGIGALGGLAFGATRRSRELVYEAR